VHPVDAYDEEERMAASLSVEDLGTVLGVWAHPDDEVYLSGGLMAAARQAGQRVVVVSATIGEHGTVTPDRWPPQRLARVRRMETAASLAALGVSEHHWLGFADGGCAEVPAPVGEAAVARLIEQVRPDTVVTFGPDGVTGHPDHRTVSAWTTAGWRASGGSARLLYAALTRRFHASWASLNERVGMWMSDERPVADDADVAMLLRCDDALLDRKLVALRAQASQTAGLVAELGEDAYRRWWAEEAFVDAATVAHQAALACREPVSIRI
jgi:LmbE family N-acetylglucosaminyl deacetylase